MVFICLQVSATLAPADWALHSDPMFERNYCADNFLTVYFNVSWPGYMEKVGEQALKAQLYLAVVAQALVVKSDISTRRARNSFGEPPPHCNISAVRCCMLELKLALPQTLQQSRLFCFRLQGFVAMINLQYCIWKLDRSRLNICLCVGLVGHRHGHVAAQRDLADGWLGLA